MDSIPGVVTRFYCAAVSGSDTKRQKLTEHYICYQHCGLVAPRGHPLPQKHHTMGFKQDAGGGKLWSLAVSKILRLILTNQDAALTDDGSLT